MTLRLSLSPEAEEKLRQRAKAAGLSPEEYTRRTIEEMLRSQRTGGGADAPPPRAGSAAELFGTGDLSPEEAERRRRHLRAWLAMAVQGTPGEVADDSRESIYDGRGE